QPREPRPTWSRPTPSRPPPTGTSTSAPTRTPTSPARRPPTPPPTPPPFRTAAPRRTACGSPSRSRDGPPGNSPWCPDPWATLTGHRPAYQGMNSRLDLLLLGCDRRRVGVTRTGLPGFLPGIPGLPDRFVDRFVGRVLRVARDAHL